MKPDPRQLAVEEFTTAVWKAAPAGRAALLQIARDILPEIISRHFEDLALARAADCEAARTEKLSQSVEQFVRDRIETALSQSDGNVLAAAELLGMKRTTLQSQIQRFGLPHNGKRSRTMAAGA